MSVVETNNSEKQVMADEGDDMVALEATFQRIVAAIIPDDPKEELAEVYSWFRKVFLYNVPHGKRNRAMAVVDTVRLIAKKEERELTEEEMEEARVLGWTVEILQAYLTVIDDMMDQSITRRGQLCWYRKEDVGLMSCNDAILLDESIYHIFFLFFNEKNYYIYLLDLMHECTRYTSYGQCMDSLSNPPLKGPLFEKYTPFRYYNIIMYKTAYYSFVLPVRLGMYMCMIDSEKEHELADDILLKIGILFQTQDDFLDCWGDPEHIGKIGTDIEEGKCAWPIMMALQKGNEEQIKEIKENFGKKDADCVKRVKELYDEINLKDVFLEEEKTRYEEILTLLDGLKTKSDLNPEIFKQYMNRIYKRQK